MRKEKVTALAIAVITIFATLPAFAAATNDTCVSVTYRFDEAEILCWLDTGQLSKNLQVEVTPGEPLLPYKIANILLPPYTNVADVSVQATLGGQNIIEDIPCGQPPCVVGEEPSLVEKNLAIYNSDELYPKMIYRLGDVYSLHGYDILPLRLYPVQYKLASKLAIYYTEMAVQIALKPGNMRGIFRKLAADRIEVETSVDNPWTLASYDSVPATVGTTATTYEYLIITGVSLSDEFQVLADWKANWVNGAHVETVSAGVSAAEIKNIILNYYTNYNTRFVLLGGDVGIIPYHTRRVSAGGYTVDIAEDYWFANLDGDDEISSYEVYIGRAPVDNEAQATNFVKKVISFEQMTKPKANLFHQSRVRYGNVPDSRQLAWQCEQYVPTGYTNYELFEENGRIERANWINFWRNNGIMCEHIGHGSSTSYYINYEVGGGSVTWSNSDVASLDNMFWAVHTSVACDSGEFEHEDCLAEEYVKDPDNGAIACFMNDKFGWFRLDDATYLSGDFIEMQFKALYKDGYQSIGGVLARSKWYFIDHATNSSRSDRAFWEWCWREINLIGDPETPLLTKRGIPTEIKIHAYPTTDIYLRSHGLSIDKPLPENWWTLSGYEFNVTGYEFTYTRIVHFKPGSHYVEYAASGYVPNYAWHAEIYINGSLMAQGDVGRDASDHLRANFFVGNITIHAYPTTDIYLRSHGLSIDAPLPDNWWLYPGYEFLVTWKEFTYTRIVYLAGGLHYVEYAASGYVPNYAWHAEIYINDELKAMGDVGRDNRLTAVFRSYLPPLTPTLSGPTSGYVYTSYTYSVKTTDPEGDNVQYEIIWGDGTSTTTGWCSSGSVIGVSHQWTRPGTYLVKAKAKDTFESWSAWSSTKGVTITQNDAGKGIDAGNTFADATSINPGSYKGTLYQSPQTDMQDWYKFYVQSGQRIYVYMTPPSGVDFDLQLYDPSQSLRASSKNGAGLTDSITFNSDKDGDWRIYIYIYSGEGQYSFYVSVYWPGGGGCPILYVYDGSEYACEGLLDIHDPDGVDIVRNHFFVTTPKAEKGAYLIRLTEHPQTHSYIDQVKLYAILEDKTLIELQLIQAKHSEYGNVLPQLLFSDDWKADTLGADHNNGTSQSIDLKFAAPPPNMKVVGFLFVIEGNNWYVKT